MIMLLRNISVMFYNSLDILYFLSELTLTNGIHPISWNESYIKLRGVGFRSMV